MYIEATHGHDVNVCFLKCLEDMEQPLGTRSVWIEIFILNL